MQRTTRPAPLLCASLLLLACGGSRCGPANKPAAKPVVVAGGEASASPTMVSVPDSPPTAIATANSAAPPVSAPPSFRCGLDAPVVSADPCASDADCAPSDPCHAHSCVAVAKANPATAGTMCTRMMDCRSVDANRCGCYQGHCALIPPP